MGSFTAKLADMIRFVRYGSTQMAQAQALQQRTEAELRALLRELQQKHEAWQADVHRTFNELTQSVMVKAADVDLQFVRNSLAADLQRETGWLRDRLTALGTSLDSKQGTAPGADASQAAPLASTRAAEEAFYLALEQQFRGTRDEIRDRLMVYRPWLSGVPPGPVGDLGCGRGEWLELVREWGLAPEGVDLNPQFVQQGRAQGLEVVCADAVQWLASKPDDSMAALTSFHVIEHLPFGVLLRLVDQARRVLKPGGRLILETPNPENLGVATQDFWLDPTHQRPLPPALLEFVLAHAGFQLEATLRLSPPEADGEQILDPTLRSLMMQGRDYAVVARKPLPAAQ